MHTLMFSHLEMESYFPLFIRALSSLELHRRLRMGLSLIHTLPT